ncbi:hypothetical protein BU17DRAFT_47421, partial [Hysterangium stoloniferum]
RGNYRETPMEGHRCCRRQDESVFHSLFACKAYTSHRSLLERKYGRAAKSIRFLLSNPKATPGLLYYINAMKRFPTTYLPEELKVPKHEQPKSR